MTITVNGRSIDFVENEPVSALLKRMKYLFPLVVVKINDAVVSTNDYTSTIIPDNSIVEVIHLISGG